MTLNVLTETRCKKKKKKKKKKKNIYILFGHRDFYDNTIWLQLFLDSGYL